MELLCVQSSTDEMRGFLWSMKELIYLLTFLTSFLLKKYLLSNHTQRQRESMGFSNPHLWQSCPSEGAQELGLPIRKACLTILHHQEIPEDKDLGENFHFTADRQMREWPPPLSQRKRLFIPPQGHKTLTETWTGILSILKTGYIS